MICIPIISKTTEEALNDIEKASKADIMELRIDYIKNLDLTRLLKEKKKKIIVTNRKKNEGGCFEGSEEERINTLKKSISLGADFIDIELSSGEKAIKELSKSKKDTKIILSYHNFEETPENLEEIYKKIKAFSPDIVKIVTFANLSKDNLAIFNFLKNKKRIISFCMGEKGTPSRILYKKFGSFLTFASLEKSKESAPGQLTFDEMKNIYRADSVNNNTKIFGLIGNPVSQSKSYFLYNTVFKKAGYNGIYINLLTDNMGDITLLMKELGMKGASVTIPFKEKLFGLLDEADGISKKIGAINTIVEDNGNLKGYNTDYIGVEKAINEETPIKGKTAVILGAGGAAKAAAYAVKKNGGKLVILNRTADKAEKLAKLYGAKFGSLENFKKISEEGYDILINTTSVGLNGPNVSPVDKKFLLPNKIVLDAVYKPIKTRLLRDAEEKNCKIKTGLKWLGYQAIGQLRYWDNIKVDYNLIEKILSNQ